MVFTGHKVKEDKTMTLKKDRMLFGTKIYNYKTKELGLILYTWENRFCDNDGYVDIPYATCVDKNGKRYNIEMDEIRPVEDFDDDELQELGLN